MRRSDPTNNVMPKWAMFLISVLPASGTSVTFILASVLDVRIKLFNLSPRDTDLVAALGLILVFTILGLLIYCIALMRALRRAVLGSRRS
jgi:hypothetical protein